MSFESCAPETQGKLNKDAAMVQPPPHPLVVLFSVSLQ